MKRSNLNKIKQIVTDLQSHVECIEILMKTEEDRLNEMDSRQRALGDKENIILRDIQSLDIARVQMNCAIEDLCKTLN